MVSQVKNINYLSILGAQRSGSTFLYEVLDQHPEIEMIKPVRPEPKFFLNNPSLSMQDFIDKFCESTNLQTRFLGEKCTSYLENPEVGNKILNLFPQAKVLVILRNPVDRALSNYNFSSQNNLETRTINQVFLEGLDQPTFGNISVNPFNYIERGFYTKYLKPFNAVFGNQLKIIILEQLLNEPIESEIFEFLNLNLPDTYQLNKNKKVNHSIADINSDNKSTREHLVDVYRKDQNELSDLLQTDLQKYWNK
jgi:hypothetical protein